MLEQPAVEQPPHRPPRRRPQRAIHVLEVNPNPYLLPSAEFSMAAKKSGRSYTDTIGAIAEFAMRRHTG